MEGGGSGGGSSGAGEGESVIEIIKKLSLGVRGRNTSDSPSFPLFSSPLFFPFGVAERALSFFNEEEKHVKFAGKKRGTVALFHVSDLRIVTANSARGRVRHFPTHTTTTAAATTISHHPISPSPPFLFSRCSTFSMPGSDFSPKKLPLHAHRP